MAVHIASKRHRPGERLMVYQDPVTRETEEGMATLVSCQIPAHESEPEEPENWLVRFDDGDEHSRWV